MINIYELDAGTPNIVKQTLLSLKGQRGPDTIIKCDFNTPLSLIGRSSRQKNQQRTSRVKPLLRPKGVN
jgi:hypothetical protein